MRVPESARVPQSMHCLVLCSREISGLKDPRALAVPPPILMLGYNDTSRLLALPQVMGFCTYAVLQMWVELGNGEVALGFGPMMWRIAVFAQRHGPEDDVHCSACCMG